MLGVCNRCCTATSLFPPPLKSQSSLEQLLGRTTLPFALDDILRGAQLGSLVLRRCTKPLQRTRVTHFFKI